MVIYLPTEASKEQLYAAVGRAIGAYASAESAQVTLLAVILQIDRERAQIIFYAVQNARNRTEMFESLLHRTYGDVFHAYWAQCSQFFAKVTLFRNAVAHWHSGFRVSVGGSHKGPQRGRPILRHPIPGRDVAPLSSEQFPSFMEDCKYIQEEFRGLALFLHEATQDSPLPEKYRQPTIRPNLADLLPRRKPKARQPQRPPSRASDEQKGKKPSRKQRRQRALAAAKRKASSK